MFDILLIIKSIVFFSLLLFVVVGFHEYGHFIAAKKLGIKVLKFSIGMGKEAYGWTGKDGVRYSLSWLPIGGYVQMLDTETMKQDEISVYSESDLKRSYDKAPIWKRFTIVAFGPLFNLILAIIGYTFISYGTLTMPSATVDYVSSDMMYNENTPNTIQKGDIIESVNGKPVSTWTEAANALIGAVGTKSVIIELKGKGEAYVNFEDKFLDSNVRDLSHFFGILPQYNNHLNIVAEVAKDSPAEHAGIKSGDMIVKINEQDTTNFYEITKVVDSLPSQTVDVQVQRGQSTETLSITLGERGNPIDGKTGFMGISPQMQEINESLFIVKEVGAKEALTIGLQRTYDSATLIINTLKKLVTGNISPTSLSGAIGIADTAQKAASYGIMSFIAFSSMFSINLMVLNLLPIKPLDGGHLFGYTIQALTGKTPSLKLDNAVSIIGICLMCTLMIVGLGNDILRIIF